MNLEITKIIKETYVEFSTDIGTGIGVLGGTLKTCDINVKYEVEFSIDENIELGKNAIIVPADRCFMRYAQYENEIQGIVDGIDDDGVLYLRLRNDCLIMIDCEPDGFKVGDFLLLMVTADKLLLFLKKYPISNI